MPAARCSSRRARSSESSADSFRSPALTSFSSPAHASRTSFGAVFRSLPSGPLKESSAVPGSRTASSAVYAPSATRRVPSPSRPSAGTARSRSIDAVIPARAETASVARAIPFATVRLTTRFGSRPSSATAASARSAGHSPSTATAAVAIG
ncbi:hypothetical protein ACH4Q7_03830 [Streptomyces roseolus]|uniref:hypothetical protein n=1 Tax=Streptomyces roseolus TaxID=67358 RepID=UPI0037AB7276